MISEILDEPIRCSVAGFGIGIAIPGRLSTGLVPHNDYLRVFFEIGLVGFVAYTFFLASLFWSNVKRLKRYGGQLFTVSLCTVVYFSVISFTQNNFYDVRNISILLVIMAVSCCCERYNILRE